MGLFISNQKRRDKEKFFKGLRFDLTPKKFFQGFFIGVQKKYHTPY